jgi:hypothetical protein
MDDLHGKLSLDQGKTWSCDNSTKQIVKLATS